MLEREDLKQVRSVVKDALREGHLDNLPDLFSREHHKHRGTHDLTFQQIVDVPDYIDNRQFITIVNEAGDGMDFIDLLGTDHQIVVTKNPEDFTLSLHHQVHIYSDEEAPRVRISNLSDTLELDPVLQFGLGAGDVVKFTQGVDDSDSDAWLLCSGDILTSLVVAADPGNMVITYSGKAALIDQGTSPSTTRRVKTHLSAASLAFANKFSAPDGSGDDETSSPNAICSDGTFFYIADTGNNRIKKHRISDGLFVWAVGTLGAGDNQFNSPWGICTDGTYLYIADRNNNRIKKHLCSDGSYVAKFGSYGVGEGEFIAPWAICTNGSRLWITQFSGGGSCPFIICLTTDLDFVAYGPVDAYGNPANDGHLDNSTISGICTDGVNLFLLNNNDGSGTNHVYKYTLAMTWASDYGASGSGDTQFSAPTGICTDETCLYITDTGNDRIKKHSLSNYGFISKIGANGDGDDQFVSPLGICIIGTFSWTGSTPYRAPILKAGLDGSYVDAYPLLRARDGFQLMEDGTIAATKYVGLYAPAAITASYGLTFPGAGPAAAGHFAVDAAGLITWGQNLIASAGPSFDHLHLTIAVGTAPIVVTSTTVCANLNAGMVDGYHHNQSLLTSASPTFVNETLTGYLKLTEMAAPGTPAANTRLIYSEDFHGFTLLSTIDDTGMVRKLMRDSVFVVRASENIAKGQAVYAFGQTGNVTDVKLAKADATGTMPSIGIAIEAITSGAYGRIMQVGLLENIDTSAFATGNPLYVSAATAGNLTATAPLYPNIRQNIGNALTIGVGNGSIQCIARSMFNEGIISHSGLLNLDYTTAGHTGFAAAAHKTQHENGGGDELSVAGLSGELADNQPPKSHSILSATHGDTDPDTVEEGDIFYGISPLPGWPLRKLIALPIPTANLTDFPEKVPIVADAAIGAACRADGFDIRFTAIDGVTLLPYERESFAVVAGEATGIFWVKTNVAMAGTSIWVYYGNSAAPDVSNGPAVFGPTGSNHAAVYHMNNLTTSTILDSTGNGNNGAKKAANEPIEATGKIGKGQDFDGADDHVEAPYSASLGFRDAFTVSLWINVSDVGANYSTFIARGWAHWRLGALGSGWGGNLYVAIGTLDYSFTNHAMAGKWDSWHHVTYTFDDANNIAGCYLDGVYQEVAAAATIPASQTVLRIRRGSDEPQYKTDGLIDEVRISSIVRSAAWIAYEYANMNPADGGLTWGAEETTAKWTKLPKGTDGDILTLVSGLPAWVTP